MRILIISFLLISACSKEIKVVQMKLEVGKDDSLRKEIHRRDCYLRVMTDRLISKDISIDSLLGKTIIEVGKL